MRPSIALLFYLLALKNNKLPKNIAEMDAQVGMRKIACMEAVFGDTPHQSH